MPSLPNPVQKGSTFHTKPASTDPALGGYIVAMITGGFTIQVATGCGTDHGKLHIYQDANTAVTGSPAPNLYAVVTPASGTCTTSITASAISITKVPPTGTTSSPTPSPVPSGVPSAVPSGVPSPAPSGSPIPPQTTKSTVTSTVAGLMSSGFVLNPANGVGYMHVYTNSATVLNSGSPATGLYAQATGTGPLNNFTATYVSFSTVPPATVTVNGVASAPTSYGFALTAASGSTIPIVMNAQTVVGGAQLTTGSTVKVTGVGSPSSSILAQQIVVTAPVAAATPTPGPISQKHVLTADYLGAPYGTTAISWSSAAPYLSWAQVTWQNANAVSAVGIKTQYYADPNNAANDGDPMYSSDETTFAHDCNGNRISFQYDGVTMYQMDIGASSLQSLFTQVVANAASKGHFDAIYEDEAGPLSAYGLPALPCNYSDSQWLAYGQALNQVSPVPVIFNGLSTLNGHDVSLSLGLLPSSNTLGGNYEHCYSDSATPKMGGWLWQAIENTELQVAAQNKVFECQLRNLGSADTQTDARIYALASFFLTYNPATSILWEEFPTPSGLHVLPESQFVLLQPKVPAPANVASLLQTGGTYGREYGQCYYAGQFVGPCAVVINPDPGSAHPFPYPQYSHTLVLSGSGVLDGGSAATNGPPPPLSLPSGEAAVVFP